MIGVKGEGRGLCRLLVFRMSNVECRISNVECRISNVECRISNVEIRYSIFEY